MMVTGSPVGLAVAATVSALPDTAFLEATRRRFRSPPAPGALYGLTCASSVDGSVHDAPAITRQPVHRRRAKEARAGPEQQLVLPARSEALRALDRSRRRAPPSSRARARTCAAGNPNRDLLTNLMQISGRDGDDFYEHVL